MLVSIGVLRYERLSRSAGSGASGNTFAGKRLVSGLDAAGHIRQFIRMQEELITIDLLPTLARLAGAAAPAERIDGRDMWPLLANSADAQPPHEALYFDWGAELHAVRSGRWKLHLPHPYQSLVRAGGDGTPGAYERKQLELSLFDLDADPGESTNVADRHPDVVKKMLEAAEHAREDLGDALTRRTGKNVREPGRIGP